MYQQVLGWEALTEGWEQFQPKVKNQSHNYHSMKVYTLEILNHQNLKS